MFDIKYEQRRVLNSLRWLGAIRYPNPAHNSLQKGRVKLLFGIAAVVISAAALPPFAHAETINQALRAAYERNPALEAERARQRADDEQVPQALSGWRPTITASGNHGYEKERTTPPVTHNSRHPGSFSFNLSQPIFRGFRTINNTRKAEALVDAGRGALHNVEQQTLLNAVTAYADVYRDRAILRYRRANVNFLARELGATKKRYRAGDVTRTDIEQAKTRLFQGQAELAFAKANLSSSAARYGSIIGRFPGRLKKTGSIAALLPRTIQDAMEVALKQNPEIVSAEKRHAAARYEVKSIHGELLPNVSLDASYERDFNGSESTARSDNRSVALRLSMPLYKGGETYSRIRQAKAVERQRRHQLVDAKARTKAQVISSWRQRQAALARIRAARLSVRAGRAAVKGVRVEAKVGERSLFDVLDSQRDLVSAQIDLANAVRDHVVAAYSVLASVGHLTARHLNLNTVPYEPDENRELVRHQPIGKVPGGLIDLKAFKTTVKRAHYLGATKTKATPSVAPKAVSLPWSNSLVTHTAPASEQAGKVEQAKSQLKSQPKPNNVLSHEGFH